jgi:phage tail sheath gpL-like
MASENITFDNIPASIRKPGKYFEFNTKLAVRTLPQNPQRVLIIGQRIAAGTILECVPTQVFSDAEAEGYFGAGSIAHLMARAAIKANPYLQLTVVSLDDAAGGVKAQGSVSITGPATSSGALTLYIGNKAINIAIASGDTAEVIATALKAEIDKYPDLPVDVTRNTATLALVAKNAGLCGTDIGLGYDVTAGGVGVTDAISAQGTITMVGVAVAEEQFVVGAQTFTWKAARGGAGQVTIGASADAACTNIIAAIAADMTTVTAARGAGNTVIITAAAAGAAGNALALTETSTNMGVSGSGTLTGGADATVNISAMTGGATNPDIQDALDAVVADQYEIIVTPFNNQTDLGTLTDHLDLVSGPMEQRPSIGVYGMTGALGACTTLSGQVNHGRALCAYHRYTSVTMRKSMPYELASAMAAVMAWEEDPARPLNTLELKGIAAANIADRLSRTEQESLFYNGVTPIEIINENVQIVRAISTYIHDPQGVDDPSLLDITTIRTLDYVRKACRERIALRFPREKLSTKTPDKVRTELLDVLLKLEALEIVEEVEANKDGLLVERDLQDVNRLDAKIPTDVVNGLHVFAGRIDLLL